uniref:Uncharacterized protein n=1 Tax=Graphocephala atropunctata TaxID=36148 RepID=A0A1B6LSN3_9HEMI
MKTLFILCFTINYKWIECENITAIPSVDEEWETMNALAESIFKRLKDPNGLGLNLIEDVYSYYNRLEDLTKAVEDNKRGAEEFLYALREKGGPKHLLLHPVDPSPLAEFYEFDKYALNQLAGFLEHTWNIWRDLEAYMEMKDNNENWNSIISR